MSYSSSLSSNVLSKNCTLRLYRVQRELRPKNFSLRTLVSAVHVPTSDLEAQQVVMTFLSYSPLFRTYLINYRPVWFSIFPASRHFYGAARSCCHGDPEACVARACLPWTRASPCKPWLRSCPPGPASSRPRTRPYHSGPAFQPPDQNSLPAASPASPCSHPAHLVPPTPRLQPMGACRLFTNPYPSL